MQIFASNVRGRTITLDVDGRETVLDVKLKIQKKSGASPSSLYFQGKPLKDNCTLTYYNICNHSNLHCSSREIPIINLTSESGASYSDEVRNVSRPRVDWSGLATVEKTEIDKRIEQRKLKHNKALEAKIGMKRKATDLANEIKMETVEADKIEANIDHMTEAIEALKKEIAKKLEQTKAFEQEKLELIKRKQEVFVSIAAKTSRIDQYSRDMKKMDVEMENTFISDKEKLQKDFEGVRIVNADREQVLKDLIATKKAILECPVCYQASSPPIYKCPMEHLICSKCFPRVNKCPTCRNPISKNSDNIFRSAEKNWEELQKLMEKL